MAYKYDPDNFVDYYEVLGVSENATSEEIKAARKKLAKKLHPDRHRNKPETEKNLYEATLKVVNEAWSVIKDPDSRREYDEARIRHKAAEQAKQRYQQQYGTSNPSGGTAGFNSSSGGPQPGAGGSGSGNNGGTNGDENSGSYDTSEDPNNPFRIKPPPYKEIPEWRLKALRRNANPGKLFTEWVSIQSFPIHSYAITKPVIKGLDTALYESGLVKNIKALQDTVIDKYTNEGENAAKNAINQFASDNRETLNEFLNYAREMRKMVETYPTTSVQKGYAGLTERQKDALIAYAADVEDLASELLQGASGKHGKEMIDIMQKINDPEQTISLNDIRSSITGLSKAQYMVNDTYVRITKKWPDVLKKADGTPAQATGEWIDRLSRGIQFGYYNEHTRTLAPIPYASIKNNLERNWTNDYQAEYLGVDENGNYKFNWSTQGDGAYNTYSGMVADFYRHGFEWFVLKMIDEAHMVRQPMGKSDSTRTPSGQTSIFSMGRVLDKLGFETDPSKKNANSITKFVNLVGKRLDESTTQPGTILNDQGRVWKSIALGVGAATATGAALTVAMPAMLSLGLLAGAAAMTGGSAYQYHTSSNYRHGKSRQGQHFWASRLFLLQAPLMWPGNDPIAAPGKLWFQALSDHLWRKASALALGAKNVTVGRTYRYAAEVRDFSQTIINWKGTETDKEGNVVKEGSWAGVAARATAKFFARTLISDVTKHWKLSLGEKFSIPIPKPHKILSPAGVAALISGLTVQFTPVDDANILQGAIRHTAKVVYTGTTAIPEAIHCIPGVNAVTFNVPNQGYFDWCENRGFASPNSQSLLGQTFNGIRNAGKGAGDFLGSINPLKSDAERNAEKTKKLIKTIDEKNKTSGKKKSQVTPTIVPQKKPGDDCDNSKGTVLDDEFNTCAPKATPPKSSSPTPPPPVTNEHNAAASKSPAKNPCRSDEIALTIDGETICTLRPE